MIDLIDQIQAARTTNNVEWMAILRIALETDPDRTKAVLKRIEENDREIHGLLVELAETADSREEGVS